MNITVYAASSGQASESFLRAARELGAELARRGHTLINGAGRTGLMAASAESCMQQGGRALGIIPQFMIDHGWQHTGMTELIVTPDMHRRKEQMAAMSDACVALPGGVGTLEELLEIITWKQLGLYLKPIVIYNVDGYYDHLLRQMETALSEHFMRPMHRNIWQVATTAADVVTLCETTPLWDPNVSKFAAL
ncbi:MAG: TIGR00730 family Rossman fold protein [Alloprevotella sp.]